jgi:hypothetical protein
MKQHEVLAVMNGYKQDAEHWMRFFAEKDGEGSDIHRCIADVWDRAIRLVEEIK